jgi:protein-tyrosine phosphatase
MSLTVLAVCTGNICRSPAVETLLRSVLDSSVDVSSAGTHALVGHPISEPMAELLTAGGFPPAEFAARQLTRELVEQADLILALTPDHRTRVVEAVPSAVHRTVTVAELGRLSSTLTPGSVFGQDDAARLATLVPAALLERPHHVGRHHDDEVIDPYRRSADTYRRSYDQILDALTPMMAALRA